MGGNSPYAEAWTEDPHLDQQDADAEALFTDDIQSNPEVCSNCFTHIRDVVLPWSWKSEVREGLVRFYVGKPTRLHRADFETDTVARNPPKACAACGSIRSATVRPLGADRAVAYAVNLSRTLAAFDHDHDPLLLAAVVARRKQFPEHASRDDRTYLLALEYSLDSTDYGWTDLLRGGPGDPGIDPAQMAWDTDRQRFALTVDDVDRPALPPGRGRGERKAHHGRPAVARRDN